MNSGRESAVASPPRGSARQTAIRQLLAGVSVIALVMSAAPASAGERPFTAGWYQQRAAARTAAAATASSQGAQALTSGQQQQVTRSLTNMAQAVEAMRAQVAAQATARAAAQLQSNPTGVADGLRTGGLVPYPNVTTDAALQAQGLVWEGANLPTETQSGSEVTVTVQQTQQKAILTWQSFNVGRNTTLDFVQRTADGTPQRDWVALNRVVAGPADANGRRQVASPSQILGRINADGEVYIINQNGIIFGGASEVNVRSLVASSLDVGRSNMRLIERNAYFRNPDAGQLSFSFQYLYEERSDGYFDGLGHQVPKQIVDQDTGALSGGFVFEADAVEGAVEVEAGAVIKTNAVESDGALGRIALIAPQVVNRGSLSAPDGQALLVGARNATLINNETSATNGTGLSVDTNLRGVLVAAGALDPVGVRPYLVPGTTISGGSVTPPDLDPSPYSTVYVSSLNLSTSPQAYAGSVVNTGVVSAERGNITLTGSQLTQSGVLAATSSVNASGSIYLHAFDAPYAVVSDTLIGGRYRATRASTPGFVHLTDGSVNSILADAQVQADGSVQTIPAGSTSAFKPSIIDISLANGYVSQFETLLLDGSAAATVFNRLNFPAINFASVAGEIDVRSGSLIKAPGATLSISTSPSPNDPRESAAVDSLRADILVRDGAVIDVSGLMAVAVAMEDNLVEIPVVTANDLADTPLQRDGTLRNRSGIVVDRRATGLRSDGTRWYGTPLFDANGYIDAQGLPVEQLLVDGGDVTISGTSLIQSGSLISVAGGYKQYDGGYVETASLISADGGHIFSIANANPNLTYSGIAGQFTERHDRWGQTKTYSGLNLVGARRRYESGYLEGGDAGSLTVLGPMIMEGQVDGGAIQGAYQREGALYASDAPTGATLDFTASPVSVLRIQPTQLLQVDAGALASTTFSLATFLEQTWSADWIEATGATDLRFGNATDWSSGTASGHSTETVSISADTDLKLPAGASISFTGTDIDVAGRITAPSGAITFNLSLFSAAAPPSPSAGSAAATWHNYVNWLESRRSRFTLEPGAVLDVAGLWVNDRNSTAATFAGSDYIDGGSVTIQTDSLPTRSDNTRPIPNLSSITLAAGSVIDLSSGGYVDSNGQLSLDSNGVPLGQGGDLSILYHPGDSRPNQVPMDLDTITLTQDKRVERIDDELVMDGTILANGFQGGGTFRLRAPVITIGGDGEVGGTGGEFNLPASFFEQGFGSYELTALLRASIDAGTQIQLRQQQYQPTFEAVYAYSRDEAATLAFNAGSQRAAVDFSLSSLGFVDFDNAFYGASRFGSLNNILRGRTFTSSNALTVEEGARIEADPEASVSLAAVGQLTFAGSIDAPAGTVELTQSILPARSNGRYDIATGQTVTDVALGGTSLFVTETASIDARGTTVLDPRQLFRAGSVLSGGDVSLAAANLIAQPGSRIDVSGIAAVLDLTAARPVGNSLLPTVGLDPTTVVSDAGTISVALNAAWSTDPTYIVGYNPLGNYGYKSNSDGLGLFETTLVATPGGNGAKGGSLSLTASAILFANEGVSLSSDENLAAELEPGTLSAPTATLPEGLKLPAGILHFGTDRLAGSGIDSLSIAGRGTLADTDGVVGFKGDVTLSVGRQLTFSDVGVLTSVPVGSFNLAGYGVSKTGVAGTAIIDAPYLALRGKRSVVGYGYTTFTAPWQPGTLTFRGDTIDVGGALLVQNTKVLSLASRGDLRFVPINALDAAGTDRELSFSTVLRSAGDIDLEAAQTYPTTAVSALVQSTADGGTIRFLGTGELTDVPLSAGGSLTVSAAEILQAGVIRAPLGRLVFGVTNESSLTDLFPAVSPVTGIAFRSTEKVELAAGSLTSTSAAGALIPYGQTTNLRDWTYNSVTDTTTLVTSPPEKSITVDAPDQTLAAGATIDLQGGGDIYAYEWVAGLGGSRNVLTTSTNGDATAEVYAIVPSYAGALAAIDPVGYGSIGSTGDTSFSNIGLTLTIGDGVAGLPAGTYLLLPGSYATLPGAYRVQVVGNSQDSLLGTAITLADGTQVIAGRLGDTFGARASRTQAFTVQSSEVWRQYSEIDQTSGTTFFSELAAREGSAAARLPTDAGRLTLLLRGAGRNAEVNLALGADLLVAVASGGRGGLVDIASPVIQVVSAGTAASGGGIVLTPEDIRSFGADSVLLGATRSSTADGDALFVVAETIDVATTAADPLTNPELILAAHDEITVAPGSVIMASGSVSGDTEPDIVVAGGERFLTATSTTPTATGSDGALLRVSAGNLVEVRRDDLRDRDSATAVDRISIGDGTRIDGGNALQLDSSKDTLIDNGALLGGENIDIAGWQIEFLGQQPSTNAIGPAALQLLTNARTLAIRAGQAITFAQPTQIAATNGGRLERLVLDTPRLLGSDLGGGLISVDATTVVLGNSFDGIEDVPVTGPGVFRASADTLVLTGNDRILSGFNRFEGIAAEQTIFGQDEETGTLTVPGDVALVTPLVTLGGGATQTLRASGALTITGGGGAAATGDAGGRVTFDAASVTIDTALAARAGIVDIRARTGDVTFGAGASLYAGGFTETFVDTRVILAGGAVSLQADQGNVVLQPGSRLDVASDPDGNGGELNVVIGSAGGQFIAASGTVTPIGDDAERGGGSFSLDSRGQVHLDNLADELIAGRFTGGIDVESGLGDLLLTRHLTASDVRLVADGGRVSVSGVIDASGASGGKIDLYGVGGVTLAAGAQLLARATSEAERGGQVTIGTTGSGLLDLAAGSLIDVSGGSDYGSSGGTVHLRVPFVDADEQTIGAHVLATTIANAVSVILEPYQRIDVGTATYNNGIIDNAAVWDAIFAQFTPATDFGATTAALQVYGDRFFVMPGLELYNDDPAVNGGDITITQSLDLLDKRYLDARYADGADHRQLPGILTLRAAGDLRIDASISDGFKGATTADNTTPSANLQSCNDTANCLTSWSYNLVAGARSGSADPLAVEQAAVFETGALVDRGNFIFGSVPQMGQTTADAAAPLGKNDIIRTGTGWINVLAGGNGLGTRAASVVNFSANAIAAGFRRDSDAAILFTSPTAVIYTAGVQVESEAGFETAVDDLASRTYGTSYGYFGVVASRVGLVANRPAFATRGGDLRFAAPHGSIVAQQNYTDVVARGKGVLTGQKRGYDGIAYPELVYAGQLFSPWLLSQGSGSLDRSETGVFGGLGGVQSARWVITGAFQQGIAAIGGGDLTLEAGGNVDNVSASIVSTYRTVGGLNATDTPSLVTYGGGNLSIDAGGNVGTIVTLVDEGNARVQAGGTIGATYQQRYLGEVDLVSTVLSAPVGPLFFIGDASLALQARGTIDIGAVAQPEIRRSFALDVPVNASASPSYARQDLSLSYGADTSLELTSAAGDINFQSTNLTFLAGYGAQQVAGDEYFSYPGEEQFVPLDAVATNAYLPPTVRLAAPQGDVTIKDGLFLAPSSVGNLDVLAYGSIYTYKVAGSIEPSIKLFDVDPQNMAGPLNPSYIDDPNDFVTIASTDPLTPVDWRLFGAGDGYALDTETDTTGILNSYYVHANSVLHLNDRQPTRLIALTGDIANGTNPEDPDDDPLSLLRQYEPEVLYVNKGALIYAGRDILNLTYVGFNASVDHVTSITSGRDITYDLGYFIARGVVAQGSDFIIGGPGQFFLQAGRDLYLKPSDPAVISASGVETQAAQPNGIRAVGNRINPYLPAESATINILFGVGPGIDQQAFIARYIDPANAGAVTKNYLADLIAYMEGRLTRQARERDPLADVEIALTSDEAYTLFQQLSATEQLPFIQQVLFSEIRIIADQLNNPDQYQNYPRAYQAIATLFPASLGYTDTLASSPTQVATGDFDMLDAVVRTEFGSAINILGPGGRATLGGLNSLSTLPANVQGVFTLRGGDVNAYVDGNFDVFNSRVLTLQGGDVTIMSGNGNVDAGRGRNTERVFPPLVIRCNPQTTSCAIDFAGLVSGAGIGTIAAVPGVPAGDVFLLAPHGVIDAGAAGIRATGNLFTVAPTVLNAENIQVGGEAVGVSQTSGPPVVTVPTQPNVADTAKAGADALDQARSAAQGGDRQLPTIYTTELVGFGGWDGPE